MDIYRDSVRRDTKASPDADVVGGYDRRRFLTVGGTSVLAAAVFAACGSSTGSGASGATTTTSVAAASNDVAILRTASSIEHVMIDTYQKLIDSGLIKTVPVIDAVKLFQSHHKDHALLYENKTTDAGGRTYTQANPVIMQMTVTPRLALVRTEMDAVQLAYDLEKTAAATFESVVGSFQNRIYNATLMSIGGVEAEHVTLLSHALGRPNLTTDGAFQKTAGAIAPDPNL